MMIADYKVKAAFMSCNTHLGCRNFVINIIDLLAARDLLALSMRGKTLGGLERLVLKASPVGLENYPSPRQHLRVRRIKPSAHGIAFGMHKRPDGAAWTGRGYDDWVRRQPLIA